MKTLLQKIEETAAKIQFSGVVSIFRESEAIYSAAFGYRDVQNKLPNQTDTRFGIASGTKFFTALGIGQLIEQGKLSFDTAVGELDDRFNHFIDPKATILNLLTHTSGIFDYYDEELIRDFDNFFVEIPWYQLETPSDYMPLFENQQMKFAPNERYAYSNGGYVFLGILIEKISGMLYRDFIQTQVLNPAGMSDSGFFAMNNLPQNTANGYLLDRQTTNVYNLPLRGGGDGGMFTTTADIRSFWEALFSYKILSPQVTDRFLETHVHFNDQSGYGCGVYQKFNPLRYSIVGGDAGVGFQSCYWPDKEITFSVFSNVTDGEEAIADLWRE
ncbi:MAG: serine hydrolase domain-containing protein [Ardenticatenaceae bacterium]|nr:serine hydrolase domain-containing protein [Ardenticatenaceae bacterium]